MKRVELPGTLGLEAAAALVNHLVMTAFLVILIVMFD